MSPSARYPTNIDANSPRSVAVSSTVSRRTAAATRFASHPSVAVATNGNSGETFYIRLLRFTFASVFGNQAGKTRHGDGKLISGSV